MVHDPQCRAGRQSRQIQENVQDYSGFGLKSPRVRQVDAHNGRQGSKEMDSSQTSRVLETNIPARLERLPWGRFHTFVVIALGITWTLDGLEVTLAGAVSPALKESASSISRMLMSDLRAVGILPALYWALFSSVGSPTGSVESDCSLSRFRSISLPRQRLHYPGTFKASYCFVSVPARASAANIPRLIPPSRNLFRRVIGAGLILSSTVASGLVRRSVPSVRLCCLIPQCCP